MQALDTNILVDAANVASKRHSGAAHLLRTLAEGRTPWALPWPCVYEFMRIVTHPRVLSPPMDAALAWRGVVSLISSPSVVLLHETPRHTAVLGSLIGDGSVRGNLLFDAHIAALCIEHGVTTLLTGDRDFARFAGLQALDPLVG